MRDGALAFLNPLLKPCVNTHENIWFKLQGKWLIKCLLLDRVGFVSIQKIHCLVKSLPPKVQVAVYGDVPSLTLEKHAVWLCPEDNGKTSKLEHSVNKRVGKLEAWR